MNEALDRVPAKIAAHLDARHAALRASIRNLLSIADTAIEQQDAEAAADVMDQVETLRRQVEAIEAYWVNRRPAQDSVAQIREASALRALGGAAGELADLSGSGWPFDPIPEVLARAEALAIVLPLVHPHSTAAAWMAGVLRTDLASLAHVDGYGLLRGPARDRYLTIAARARD